MKRSQPHFIFFGLTILFFNNSILAISIDSCYAMARRNYPLVKQHALIEKSKEYSISNANKGYLPQLNIAGQATYQSEVTKLPISIPNMTVPSLSKDQYKLYAEVAQPITDLFTLSNQKELVESNAITETQKIEVELYKVKERINGLYFGILLIDAQIAQTELMKKDIQSGIDKTNTAIANGTALKSNADILQVEILKASQRIIELKSNRKGYADMLSLFINQNITENTLLESPLPHAITNGINRPELTLYDTQKKSLMVQTKLVNNKNLPKFSLFLQGGYGRPALNMLNNDFKSYYIGGLRLNWNVSNLYTLGKEKQIITINQNALDIQKEVFLFNTSLNLKQQNAEVTKLQELVSTDNQIIQLREQIKKATNTQLANGTATSADYLLSVNAEDQAKQNLILHQIQLLLAQYNYQTISGN